MLIKEGLFQYGLVLLAKGRGSLSFIRNLTG